MSKNFLPEEERRGIFAQYARERSHAPLAGFRLQTVADLARHFPGGADDEAVLSFARFATADSDARIDAELRNLKANGWAAEWKVHEFDQPPDLKARLEARGLTSHHEEALMVLPLEGAPMPTPQSGGIEIEEAQGAALDEIVAFQEAVWKCRLPWLAGVLHQMAEATPGSCVIYCARDGGRMVGSGWIDFHGGSQFAQLSGGAVHEDYRGRGVYSQLFAHRLAQAKARNVAYIAVDAAPMSRPILEHKGFRFICHTYPMRTRPFDTSAVTRS